jgi:hypothetical protein
MSQCLEDKTQGDLKIAASERGKGGHVLLGNEEIRCRDPVFLTWLR